MKTNLPKLPIDIQSFETMRAENYLYVDKTRNIWKMVTEGKFYFLSRPRRFGKSLLASTLKCLFQGRKELFEGLWLTGHTKWEWLPYPVILLDFNEIPGSHPEELKQGLSYRIGKIAQSHDIFPDAPFPELQFHELILALAEKTGMPVVVLVDEYDKRIIDHLGKGEERLQTAKANRDILKNFFGILKGQTVSSKLRFVFLTGVSRFGRVSIFSELNNLRDITMLPGYADLLGYTREELETCFQPHLELLGKKFQWSHDKVLAELSQTYNGYRFSSKDLRVSNPFSILNAFQNLDFQDYWFETATPSFLIHLLNRENISLPELENLAMDKSITTYDLDHLRPEILLLQTGYLTIKDVDEGFFILDYPNREVKQAFVKHLLSSHGNGIRGNIGSELSKLPSYLEQENYEAFFHTVKAMFASIPYDIETKRDEAYFHTVFYLIVTSSGIAGQSSVLTCKGRIDMVIELMQKVFLVEFKCNQSARKAIRQIENNRYADKYLNRDLKVILVGINFSTKTRNVEEWEIRRKTS